MPKSDSRFLNLYDIEMVFGDSLKKKVGKEELWKLEELGTLGECVRLIQTQPN